MVYMSAMMEGKVLEKVSWASSPPSFHWGGGGGGGGGGEEIQVHLNSWHWGPFESSLRVCAASAAAPARLQG